MTYLSSHRIDKYDTIEQKLSKGSLGYEKTGANIIQ